MVLPLLFSSLIFGQLRLIVQIFEAVAKKVEVTRQAVREHSELDLLET